MLILLLLRVIFSELESLLQAICSGKGNNIIVLESTHGDARGNAYLFCESLDLKFVESIGVKESLIFIRRYEKILGKTVCLLFLFATAYLPAALTFCLYEDILFLMKKDVTRLVEESIGWHRKGECRAILE